MSTHTPGPWKWTPSLREGEIRSKTLDAEDRTVVFHSAHWLPRSADLKLIAAAPELLAELRHLVLLMSPHEADGSLAIRGLATLNAARAAIKKATA